jgi:hypothetical protein
LTVLVDFEKLEELAKEYVESKKHKGESEATNASLKLIDQISSTDFAFPLKKEAIESNGTTTYVYINNNTYPNLIEFVAQILHLTIPIMINNAKFGPGEIIVNKDKEKEAKQDLLSSVKELQKLISGKRNKLFEI